MSEQKPGKCHFSCKSTFFYLTASYVGQDDLKMTQLTYSGGILLFSMKNQRKIAKKTQKIVIWRSENDQMRLEKKIDSSKKKKKN